MAAKRDSSSLGVELEVTPDAARLIADRGGQLFLWQTDVGRAWLRDRVAFEAPAASTFVRIRSEGVSIMIADDFPLPETLRISLHRFPPGRLRVEWDDEAWGGRGDSAADPGVRG